MHRFSRSLKVVAIATVLLAMLLYASPVEAVPVSFTWGSFNASGLTTYGVYDTDNVTILQTGDLTQLIWAGPNGIIDPPQCGGTPGGDDQLLDSTTVQNTGSLPPTARNKGYVPLKTYSFDTTNPQSGGVVYIRAWNASTTTSATAYGDSATGTLTGGGIYNAARWYTNNVFATATWNGPAGGNWQTAGNWSTGIVPDCKTYVVIPSAANVQLSANAASRSLTIANTATLNLSTFDVTVEDTLANNGTLTQVKNVPNGSTTEFLRIRNAAGTSDKYHGVDITPAVSMNLTSVTIRGNQHCTSNPADALLQRCFNITPGTAANATLCLWYTEAERNSQAANALKLWHYGPWAQVGNNYTYSESGVTCASGTACWMQAQNVSTFSPFGVGSGAGPTAITVSTFTATGPNNIAVLPILIASVLGMGGAALLLVRRRR